MNKKHETEQEDETLAEQAQDLATEQTFDNLQIQQLQQELEQAQAALAEANDKALRFKAEADNARRRAVLDVENARKFSIEKIAGELLSVVDSLEKGLEAVSDAETEKEHMVHMQQGMELTHKLLLNLLEKFNIHQINPLGSPFDPKQHEALTTQATNEMEPNRVLTVVQKGFLIHDRILRPARVVVSKEL